MLRMWPAFGEIAHLQYLAPVFVIILLIVAYIVLIKPMNRVRNLSDLGFSKQTRTDNFGRNRRQIANEIRRLQNKGNMPPAYPNGWFVACESDDLKKGDVRPLDILGENLVVFRTEEGNACILDAYCPHLGAHLGVGSRVIGDCVECPFHGWRFRGEDGQCTTIPYSSGKVPQIARVKSWSCDESNGFIYVWYHAENEPPTWKVPAVSEINLKRWTYSGRSEYLVNAHIQEIPENGADVAHLDCLHGPSMLRGSDLDAIIPSRGDSPRQLLKHQWSAKWEPNATEKHIAVSRIHHEMLILGSIPLISVDVEAWQIGPGVVHLFIDTAFGRCLLIETVTPIEPTLQRVLHRLYAPWFMPAPFAKLIVWGEALMFERDVGIWNNKTYIDKPILVSEDRAITQHRRWYNQFYSENSPRITFRKGNKDPTDW